MKKNKRKPPMTTLLDLSSAPLASHWSKHSLDAFVGCWATESKKKRKPGRPKFFCFTEFYRVLAKKRRTCRRPQPGSVSGRPCSSTSRICVDFMGCPSGTGSSSTSGRTCAVDRVAQDVVIKFWGCSSVCRVGTRVPTFSTEFPRYN